MQTKIIIIIISGIIGLAQASVPELKMVTKNPFRVPMHLRSATKQRDNLDIINSAKVDLRAIMVAGSESLINIAGKIYAVGDYVGSHKVVLVQEDEVVFAHNDKFISIYMPGAKEQE